MVDQGRDDTPVGPQSSIRRQILIIVALLAVAAGISYWLLSSTPAPRRDSGGTQSVEAPKNTFKPTESQWAGLVLQVVEPRNFRSEIVTDGKISIDEDNATPVFSPYSGQVRRLIAQPGEMVKAGQLLFTIEATDMVLAQNDFITANASLSTAQSLLKLATTNEQRQHDLYKATAGPLKDWQQAQADLIGAQNNLQSAGIALEAVRNRLRILKKTEAEIDEFQKSGKINPETPIYAPIGGTIVQRKVGPGQFITSGGTDPTGDAAFVIGDLSTVWLIANVREADAQAVAPGQSVEFRVPALSDRVFNGKLNFTSSVLDASTRRLTVRGAIENQARELKPEMFARVTIITGEEQHSPAVPASAIIYEGDTARVWIASAEKALELRQITTGLTSDGMVQVRTGLDIGDNVVTKGTLFIDRAASG